MKAAAALAALALLAACAGPPGPGAPAEAPPLPLPTDPLPPMKSFGPAHVAPPERPNGEMARDFLDLSFRLESGRALPVLTRFEGPITIAVTGARPAQADRDLDAVLARFRGEAHLPVRLAAPGEAAGITIAYLPRATMQATVPTAACFVTPNVTTWAEYHATAGAPQADWTRLTARTRLAVFIPDDTAPEDIRDCLNEELAQAMGPVNDLYRLQDSVFNDDNFQAILTGFDMLMLRVYYDPALRNGMTRDEVAARLPAILARLNPAGERPAGPPLPPSPPEWRAAVEAALGPRGGGASREAAARRALAIARAAGWQDNRAAFSAFLRARMAGPQETEAAVQAMATAQALWARLPATEIQRANITLQLAAFALTAHQPEEVVRLADSALPTATRAQNAGLLAMLGMLKSRALLRLGRGAEARALWLDSLGWARYGFGSDRAVRQHEAEVLALDAGKGEPGE